MEEKDKMEFDDNTFFEESMRIKKLLSLLTLVSFSLFQSVRADESYEDSIEEFPVVVLGGGVGALTSATYLARAGISPLVITGPVPGGALTQSHSVQNWPGELEISGIDLVEKMQAQALVNGAILRSENVIDVDFSKAPYTITTKDPYTNALTKIQTQACIIAVGSVPNLLHVPGEKTYWSNGVYSCAVCDGSLYKDKTIAVVGGGDAALTEVNYLSNIAKKVFLIVRKDQFKTVEEQRKRQILSRPNVEVLYRTTVEEVKGDGQKVTSLVLQKNGNQRKELAVDALFLAIGAKPNTELFKGQLALDEQGFILLENKQQTSIKGIFALGDVVDREFNQAITASGDGAKAALQAQKWLSFAPQKNLAEEKKKHHHDVSIPMIKNTSSLQAEIDKKDKPIFIYFSSPSCHPCRHFGPIYQDWANEYSSKVRFLKVDTTAASSELTNRYQVRSIPCVVILDKDGNFVRKEEGAQLASLGISLRQQKQNGSFDVSNIR